MSRSLRALLSLHGGSSSSRAEARRRWRGAAALIVLLAVQGAAAAPSGTLDWLAGALDGRGAVDGPGSVARIADDAVSRTDNTAGAVANGNTVYLSDLGNHAIREVSPLGVRTLAGALGQRGHNDGAAGQARFDEPAGIAIDRDGSLIVADSGNHAIRRVTTAGTVTTLAGVPGSSGANDGTRSTARFNHPQGVAVDSAGNIFVADRGNHAIRRISPSGEVVTWAGDSRRSGAQDGRGSQATFSRPQGLAVNRAGELFVTDADADSIRKVSADGLVSTLALLATAPSFEEARNAVVRLRNPNGIAIEHDSDLVVVESDAHRVRRVSAAGFVSNVAGNFDSAGGIGARDGAALQARFFRPSAVAVAATGELFIVDLGNATVRSITPLGQVRTVAGKARARGPGGSADGTSAQARFNFLSGAGSTRAALATAPSGEVWVAETLNHVVRKIAPDGRVTTVAGNSGAPGFADGRATDARFSFPSGAAVDGEGIVFVADPGNHAIRRIDRAGMVSTLAGNPSEAGSSDGLGTEARFNAPAGIAIDASGTLYVSDAKDHLVRKIDRRGSVSTLAGSAGMAGNGDGQGTAARFDRPGPIASDGAGNLYVIDGPGASRVRRVSADGAVTTPSSSWRLPALPNWGPVRPAAFSFAGVAADENGTVYVSNATVSTLWRVQPDGSVEAVAGDPERPGLALGPLPGQLDHPGGLARRARNEIFVTSGNAVLTVHMGD